MPISKDETDMLFGDVNGHSEGLCPQCRSPLIHDELKQEIELGDGETIFARVPIIRCEQCNLTYSAESFEEVRDAAIRVHQGLLGSAEIATIRKRLGYSRREFADAFGVPPASMERWENGRLIQSRSMDTLLRAIMIPSVATILDRRKFGSSFVREEGNVIQFRSLKERPNELARAREKSDNFDLRRM